jgi:hypothetical protein
MNEILELLKQGCSMHFTSGYVLKGDPVSGYIDTGWLYCSEYIPDGLRTLSLEGLKEALSDAKNFNITERT